MRELRTPVVKVDMSPKSDVEVLDVSGNISEQDEEPDIEEDAYRPQNPLVARSHQKLTLGKNRNQITSTIAIWQ